MYMYGFMFTLIFKSKSSFSQYLLSGVQRYQVCPHSWLVGLPPPPISPHHMCPMISVVAANLAVGPG